VLILKGLPCDAALQRGLLRHSWLKNQILQISPDFVAQVNSRPSLWEERESFEKKIQSGGEFETKLNDARQLIRDMVKGFSPEQLVDRGPLANLSQKARESVKAVIHDIYLRQTKIEQYTEPVTRAIDDLENALREFTTVWYLQQSAEQNLIRNRFEQVQECARILHEKLGDLPEGIVLP